MTDPQIKERARQAYARDASDPDFSSSAPVDFKLTNHLYNGPQWQGAYCLDCGWPAGDIRHLDADFQRERLARWVDERSALLAERKARASRRWARRSREVPKLVHCPFEVTALARQYNGLGSYRCDSCGLVFRLTGLTQIDKPRLRATLGLPKIGKGD